MTTYNNNDIAIIGTSIRLPELSSNGEYWSLLANKKTNIVRFDCETGRRMRIAEEKLCHPNFIAAGSVLQDVYAWDANFFGYSPKAASLLDPQQRLLLECGWEIFERAGYNPLQTSCKTGVYVAAAHNNYSEAFRKQASPADDYLAFASNDVDFAATRLSYQFNLKGPSMTVQTACSSSLVAVHLACESLLNLECDLALAGGVSIVFPQAGYLYDPNLIFSAEGCCKPFNSDGQGTVFGNGLGLVLLKRLQDAVNDHDNIQAVIKGSAVNNDGHHKNSFYSPSIEGQKEVILNALQVAQVLPETIGFVEAHGTGTALGDPIEVTALTEAYRNFTSKKQYCYLGSVKSNIGHLNTASGIAGLIKCILCLQQRAVPATLHFTKANQEIDFENSPFLVNQETVPWVNAGAPLRSAVSSFGVGGTNAHVILEEFHANKQQPVGKKYFILPFSAKTTRDLKEYKRALTGFLERNPQISIGDAAFTLQQSRSALQHREYVVCVAAEDALAKLREENTEAIVLDAGDQLLVNKWTEGEEVDWNQINSSIGCYRTELPVYCWNKKEYAIESYVKHSPQTYTPQTGYSLLAENISVFDHQEFRMLFTAEDPIIRQHNGMLPAAAYIEMVFAALRVSGKNVEDSAVRNFTWLQPYAPAASNPVHIHLKLVPRNPDEIGFSFFTESPAGVFASGSVVAAGTAKQEDFSEELALFRQLPAQRLEAEEIYSRFKASGFYYGEKFQLLKNVKRQGNKASGTIQKPDDEVGKNGSFFADPFVMDAAFQTAASLLPGFDDSLQLFVPYEVEEIRFCRSFEPVNAGILAKRQTTYDTQSILEKFDVYILDEAGRPFVCFQGLSLVNKAARQPASKHETPVAAGEPLQHDAVRQAVEAILLESIAEELGHALTQISAEDPFFSIGLDSVVLIGVINRMDSYFPNLPKTLFFEYSNIVEVTGYLLKTYPEASATIADKWVAPAKKEPDSAAPPPPHTKIIDTMQAYSEQTAERRIPRPHDVAIIGVHGIYPEAANLKEFWHNLQAGKDCIREIPQDRWPIDGFYSPDINSMTTSYSKWGGFIEKMDHFDPVFFKIPPKEAEFIDPQERLFLESAWCAIENAGYTPKNVCGKARKAGVYVGVMWGHYQLFAVEELQRGNIVINTSAYWSIANRVSFTMNFNGPSMAVDTACSSSLSAIHLACNSIISGESEIAIAGGINLNLHPYKYYLLSGRRFASTDGRCRAFGEGGSGYVPSEGVGTVLLKSLSQAIEDRDTIYGVIKGTRINHGGKASGYTVPNSHAQSEVVRSAIEISGVSADDISYVEAHGTGTSLGDPIEINGLVSAFSNNGKERQPCPIGSVKSNIGHLESAAGIASVHKVLLQLEHGLLAPSIHCEPLNPFIDFTHGPFVVQKELAAWKPSKTTSLRVAGISSFGAGGANAHVIIEEYKEDAATDVPAGEVLIILSAQDEPTMHAYAQQMLNFIRTEPRSASFSLLNFSYTLQVGRIDQLYRLAFTARTVEEVQTGLTRFLQHDANTVFYHKADKTKAHATPEEIDAWMLHKNHAALGRAWSQGATVNWDKYYRNNKPRRIPLPNYPFNKRKLWYEPLHRITGKVNGTNGSSLITTPAAIAVHPAATASDNGTALHATSTNNALSASPPSQVHCLVLAQKPRNAPSDPGTRTARLVVLSNHPEDSRRLQAFYSQPASIVRSADSAVTSPGNYTVNSLAGDCYEKLYQQIAPTLPLPGEVDIVLDVDNFPAEYHQYNYFYKAQVLTAVFENIKQASIHLKQQKINFLLHFTGAEEKDLPVLRALASLVKVAAKEQPRMRFMTIEFQHSFPADGKAAAMVAELNQPPSATEIVYNKEGSFQAELRPLETTLPPAPVVIKNQGVYMITGGMGAIGMVLAAFLLRKGAARVVLTGRKNKEDLTDRQKHFLNTHLNRIIYTPADITDYAQVKKLVESIVAQYGRINGVIYAAGIIDDKLIQKKSRESFNGVVAAKISGALNIDTATENLGLDFTVYCSSVSALAGPMGQVDYAAANRFLDEYATYKNERSAARYISVNWPYWNEGGMKIPQPFVDMMQKSGIWGISEEEGLEALEKIFDRPATQVIVVKGTEQGMQTLFGNLGLRLSGLQAENRIIQNGQSHGAPAGKVVQALPVLHEPATKQNDRTADYTDTLLTLKDTILSSISEASGLAKEDIDTSVNFEEYGLDSVLIMKVSSEIEKFIPQLSISLFFECKTIDEILAKIGQELADGNMHLHKMQPVAAAPNQEPEKHLPPFQREEAHSSPAATADFLREKITELICASSGLTASDISPVTDLEEYGLDSVMIMKVSSELEKYFSGLSISLFFECKTINDIVGKIQEELLAGSLVEIRSSTVDETTVALPETGVARQAFPLQPQPFQAGYYTILQTTPTDKGYTVQVQFDTGHPAITGHAIKGQIILAGAAYIVMVRGLWNQPGAAPANCIRNMTWMAPLLFDHSADPAQTEFTTTENGVQFSVTANKKKCVQGELVNTMLPAIPPIPVHLLKAKALREYGKADIYGWFREQGFEYGSEYQIIDRLYVGSGEVLGVLNSSPGVSNLTPMLLDGAFQCIAGFTISGMADMKQVWIPFFLEKMLFHTAGGNQPVYVHIIKDTYSANASIQQFNISLLDEQGNICVQIENFTLKAASLSAQPSAAKPEITHTDTRKTGTDPVIQASGLAADLQMNDLQGLDPVAVVSVSCKLPGSDSPEEFWEILQRGKETIREIPPERWDCSKTYDPVKGKKDKTYSKWGGFLRDIDQFDAAFFRIKESEAVSIDPQQRILLELTQHLFERAGYSQREISGKQVAIIIGGAAGNWIDLIVDLPGEATKNVVVNTIQNMLSARISDFYDLKGTSLTIDTACSSSLVAIHEACQKIRNKECTMAVAGGITLLLTAHSFIGFSQAQVLSADGKCHVFDKYADGIVLGEGAGLVLLKSYQDAVRDGDQILAVIRGSAVNNDGKTMGITTPNLLMQKEVIKSALDNARVSSQTITYLEAHGTGTLLGDPIEIKAAGEAFGRQGGKGHCAVASVKSNIGHTLHASGVASFIKVVLALQHKLIPPTLNCDSPHPRFEFEHSQFYPVTTLKNWTVAGNFPRRAGISSFGFGGTNCHLILEEVSSAYTPVRTALPLTRFKRKRFWPGNPTRPSNGHPATDNGVGQKFITYEDILRKLESGEISTEEAVELENSLIK
ncbi:MAG: SDR family NAD(P)-dependent oxidoreductase [Williamsia sp.]|nr:SDR family NAD(P)-dependent oxidoreductase [Williamsia sp.]